MIPHVAVDKILGLGLDLHLHARVPHELEGGIEVVDLLDTLVAGLECLAGVLPLRQRFNQLYEKVTVTVLNIHHPRQRVTRSAPGHLRRCATDFCAFAGRDIPSVLHNVGNFKAAAQKLLAYPAREDNALQAQPVAILPVHVHLAGRVVLEFYKRMVSPSNSRKKQPPRRGRTCGGVGLSSCAQLRQIPTIIRPICPKFGWRHPARRLKFGGLGAWPAEAPQRTTKCGCMMWVKVGVSYCYSAVPKEASASCAHYGRAGRTSAPV